MTAIEKITNYLSKRSTGATSYEVAEYAKVNYNTARKLLASFKKGAERKCRISGLRLTTYSA